jgi:hypothetical protein
LSDKRNDIDQIEELFRSKLDSHKPQPDKGGMDRFLQDAKQLPVPSENLYLELFKKFKYSIISNVLLAIISIVLFYMLGVERDWFSPIGTEETDATTEALPLSSQVSDSVKASDRVLNLSSESAKVEDPTSTQDADSNSDLVDAEDHSQSSTRADVQAYQGSDQEGSEKRSDTGQQPVLEAPKLINSDSLKDKEDNEADSDSTLNTAAAQVDTSQKEAPVVSEEKLLKEESGEPQTLDQFYNEKVDEVDTLIDELFIEK